MRVVKNINNNVVVCVTSAGREVIAFGKGLGFKKPPYDIELSQIDRTFYDVDNTYVQMINEIPQEILDISARVIDYTRKLVDKPVGSNVVFTLADHINFAIKRIQTNMNIKLPILYDVEHLFETEVKVGKMALQLIKTELNINLPKEEAVYIALHIINAEGLKQYSGKGNNTEKIIEDTAVIIEDYFNIIIDRTGFNFSRFAMHVRYLIQRVKDNQLVAKNDTTLYDLLADTLPDTEKCVVEITRYLNTVLNCELTLEEQMYLMIYINRFCSREDSCQ